MDGICCNISFHIPPKCLWDNILLPKCQSCLCRDLATGSYSGWEDWKPTVLMRPQCRVLSSGMEGKAIFFTGRCGEGKAKNLWGGAGQEAPPPPHSAGRGREGVKIWGAGKGRGGEHTVGISWLQSYSAAKEMLICIALIEFNLLNIHNLYRNHN